MKINEGDVSDSFASKRSTSPINKETLFASNNYQNDLDVSPDQSISHKKNHEIQSMILARKLAKE